MSDRCGVPGYDAKGNYCPVDLAKPGREEHLRVAEEWIRRAVEAAKKLRWHR